MTASRPARLLLHVRLGAYGLFAGVLATSLLVAAGVVDLESALARRIAPAAGIACAAAFVLVARWRPLRRRRWLAVLDLVAANVLATLVLAELAVNAWMRWFPSPLAFDQDDAEAAIRAHRLPPGSSYFGFPVNSLGCHDEEFFVADDDDVVVALLADSFGVGTVPFDFNFATVAERRLAAELPGGVAGRRVAVHDFGISSIGPAQYVLLAAREVPRYRPKAVVVCLFVGNDVTENEARVRGPRLCALQGWASWQLAGRLARVVAAREDVARLGAIGRAEAAPAQVVPPWVEDPSLEVPTFAPERYLQLETDRAAVTDATVPATQRGFERLGTALDGLAARFRERLGVVLIPDEFQVDDALWNAILARVPDPSRHDRLLPQQRILAHCERRGIAALDLLPALRAASEGGARRLYHLRDTHWNAAGNRVAGEAIARWLLPRL